VGRLVTVDNETRAKRDRSGEEEGWEGGEAGEKVERKGARAARRYHSTFEYINFIFAARELVSTSATSCKTMDASHNVSNKVCSNSKSGRIPILPSNPRDKNGHKYAWIVSPSEKWMCFLQKEGWILRSVSACNHYVYCKAKFSMDMPVFEGKLPHEPRLDNHGKFIWDIRRISSHGPNFHQELIEAQKEGWVVCTLDVSYITLRKLRDESELAVVVEDNQDEVDGEDEASEGDEDEDEDDEEDEACRLLRQIEETEDGQRILRKLDTVRYYREAFKKLNAAATSVEDAKKD